MASLSNIIPGGFNSANVQPQAPQDGTPLPAGTYTVEITGAEVKPLSKGGTGLNLEFTVVDPEQYARRKVWSLLCIQHGNPQTEQIAQSQLSAICRAVGIIVLQDTDELFGRILRVKTKVRPAEGQYAAKAEVTGYEAAGTPQPAAAPAPAPAAAGGAKPWQRKAA